MGWIIIQCENGQEYTTTTLYTYNDGLEFNKYNDGLEFNKI